MFVSVAIVEDPAGIRENWAEPTGPGDLLEATQP
jgi:hypothetical protein